MTADPSARRLGVLISGGGTNLQSLIDAISAGQLDATIAVVIANEPSAGGLRRAAAAGIEAIVLDHRGWPSREDYDRALAGELIARQVSLVVLAGFMRVVGLPLLAAFPNAIVNIHPSLLPSFPGVDAPGQAIRHGVKVSGVTVHLVDAQLDSGPIVMQRAVAVDENDTRDALAARILVEEHRLLPQAVQALLDGGWRIEGRKFLHATTRPRTV